MGISISDKLWTQSKWPVIISIGLTVIYGTHSCISSKQDKAPTYAVESTSLISKSQVSIPKLVVTYDGAPVDQLTSTNIRFWNAGKKSIRQNDISRTNILRICIPKSVKVLSFDIVKVSALNARPVIKRITTSEGEYLSLQFEFLDYNEGFSVQVLNDGRSSQYWQIKGKFIESRPISQFNYQPERYSITLAVRNIFFLFITMFVVYLTHDICRRNQSFSKGDKVFFTTSYLFMMYLIYSVFINFQVRETIPVSLR